MRINIYTDSKFDFGVIHVHEAIQKERGQLPSQGTQIKHGKVI